MSVTSSSKKAPPSKLQTYFTVNNFGDEKIKLEWKDLNYNILMKDAKKSSLFKTVYNNKAILSNLSGSAESGQLLAILGPTGCGKTSLLNCLAARVSSAGSSNMKLTGSIRVNGKERNDVLFRKKSAYVLQDDRLYPQLTVLETMMLSAQFYLPTSVSDAEKLELVMSVIAELGLIKAKDTQIGDEKKRGVSGGERKRVNIACQLISNPSILFLDEPTSGLDSFQALSVMESMKAMALNGRLVISVIHQPRSSIFDMFDKLLLLSGGRTMYSGDATGAVQWFTQCGFPCPRLFNPSDYFLDILSYDNRTPELDQKSTQQVGRLGSLWLEYHHQQQQQDDVSLLNTQTNAVVSSKSNDHDDRKSHHTDNESSSSSSNFLTSFYFTTLHASNVQRVFKNFKLLSWRSWSQQSRDKVTLFAKVFFSTFFACIIAAMYNNAGHSQEAIYNRLGLLFIVTINQAFNALSGVLSTFPKEKTIVNRERNANAYDTLSYFLAKFITEIPLNVIPPLIFSSIVYFIVGLNQNAFGYFLLIVMLESLTAVALGLAVSAGTPTIEAANALGPPLLIISLIFGGFYINLASLPPVAEWIPYLSIIRWTFEALAINEFTGETFTCKQKINADGSVCTISGESVLQGLSFDDHTTAWAVFGLGMLLLCFTGIAIVLLYISKGSFLSLGFVGSKQKRYQIVAVTTTSVTTDTEGDKKDKNNIISKPSVVISNNVNNNANNSNANAYNSITNNSDVDAGSSHVYHEEKVGEMEMELKE